MTALGTRGAMRAALVALIVPLAVGAPRASAAGVRAGKAVVVSDAGSTDRRDSGGSATTFSLQLPQGASCPGDSANDNYRVQSFLVPARDDPGTFTYYSDSAVGPGRYALYDIHTNPYIQAQTANATKPGGPGPIVDIPALNFAVFDKPPGLLPPGRYHIGIACSLWNKTVRYWDVDIQLTAAPADLPAHLEWRVVGTHPAKRSNWLRWALGAGAVLAAGFALLSWLASRRSRSSEGAP